jgi:hypothetical protein
MQIQQIFSSLSESLLLARSTFFCARNWKQHTPFYFRGDEKGIINIHKWFSQAASFSILHSIACAAVLCVCVCFYLPSFLEQASEEGAR